MSRHVGRHRHRVVCPVCKQVRTALWSPDSPGEELLITPHNRPPVGGLTLLGPTGKPVGCRGGSARVGPEATPARPRQVSYEETVRAIGALLDEETA